MLFLSNPDILGYCSGCYLSNQKLIYPGVENKTCLGLVLMSFLIHLVEKHRSTLAYMVIVSQI
jgi:hypothetical protein